MEFSYEEIAKSTSAPVIIVILVMLVMAVGSVYVAVDRIIALSRARAQSRRLAEAISPALAAGSTSKALSVARQPEFKNAYLGHMLIAGLAEFDGRPDHHGVEAVGRALERVSITEGADLRRGLNILATTGSTAPFVGLVGTILGIINAFKGMAESGSGGLASVSAGIAEALITTAIGITVAIIGVWLFNLFTAWIDSITNDMQVSTQEFIDWCEKRLLSPMGQAAK